MQGEEGKFPTTSYNRYFGDIAFYTPEAAGEWIGITSRRVRQLSELHGIGKKTKRYWKYTLEDLKILDTMHRSKRSKSSMRNVTPRGPKEIADMMNSQDELLRYVADQFKRLRQETFALIQDVSRGNYNAMVKMYDRHEKAIFNIELTVKELRYPKKEKEDERGRPALCLGRAARVTLNEYEAEAA